MASVDFRRLLYEAGYVPFQLTERVVSTSTKNALAVLGESSIRALMFHMTFLSGMTEKELLADHKAFEKSLRASIGFGADIIISHFNEELAKNLPDRLSDLPVDEVLSRINRDELQVFMRNIAMQEHAVLIYRNGSFRDKMMNAFFDPVADTQGPKGAIMSGEKLAAAPTITYEQMGADHDKLMKTLSDWISSVRSAGAARIGKDNTWLLENGFEKEILSAEKAAGPKLSENMALLCAYDIAKLNEKQAKVVVETHKFVVLEEPQIVYMRK